ncbi:MAG: OmpA family protein [Polyangiales bacterium]
MASKFRTARDASMERAVGALARRVAMALPLACALIAAPRHAEAVPFGQRITLRGELLLSHVVGEPQTRVFGFGFFGVAHLGLALTGPLSLQASGSVGIFPPVSSAEGLPLNVTATYTAGVRIEPRTVRPEGRLFVDANAGVAATGTDTYRFAFDVGIGWEIAVTRYISLGPVVRYWHILQPDDLGRSEDGKADAHYVSFGLSMAIRPSPPPRTRAGTLLAINPDNAPDADYDGVPDFADECPDVVEDHDGYRDEDGCPDLDDDGDNFPDSEDRCPRQAETPNGFEDEDGCPDTPPASREVITIVDGQLRLRQRVYFAGDRATIPNYSIAPLRAVAQYLIEHPEVRRLRVEGNADDSGTRRHGFELSLRRALAVVNFLVDQGVERERLEALGLGDLRPIAQHHDEVTRARNRRIDFSVVSAAPAAPTGAWTPAEHPLNDLAGPRR